MKILLILATFTTLAASASEKPLRLDPSEPMTRYTIAAWRDTSGLPVDSVSSIAQTRDGYLWIGTEHGLVRFDGVGFKTFTTSNTPQLRSNEIFTLFAASNGILWIGTRGGGAVTFDGSRFTRVPIKYRYIGGFSESQDGSVWIGAPGGIARFRDGRYTFFEKKEGYPGGLLMAVAADGDGVYVGLPSGVLRISAAGAKSWTSKDGLTGGTITSLRVTRGGLLAGDQTGNVYKLSGDRFERVFRSDSTDAITSILEGAKGSLWLSTIGGGLLRYAEGRLERLTERDGLTSNSLNQLLEDDEGNLWAGGTGGGLMQLKAPRLTTIEPSQPLDGEWILAMTEVRDGSVWFGTNGGGLNRLQGQSLTRMGPAAGLHRDTVAGVAEDSRGAIWVGSNTGLQQVVNGRVVRNITKADGLSGTRVLTVAASRLGGVWVSMDEGLHYVSPSGRARKLTEKDGVTSGYIVSIREMKDGSLWLAKPGAVEHLANGRLTRFGREQGLASRTVGSITIDEIDGTVWVATMADGLFAIHNGKVRRYQEADGLLTNSVYGVVQDRAGDLWIPTGRGLFTIKRAELKRFDTGESKQIDITTFRKADGLKSSDFSGGFDRPGFRSADGTLWFPTTRGLVVVDPDKIRTNLARPRVFIEDVVANGVRYGTPAAPIAAPRGHRQMQFTYSAPTFYSPESLSFQYMLEGFDEEWQNAGSRRTAYYTNVPPGDYRFVVRAKTAEGRLGESSTGVQIEPHLYETWRFRIAVALFLILIALVIHRQRVESIQRHQAELETSEEHFRSLIENASDMIIEVGVNGCVTYASPSVQRILGLRPYAINGRELSSVLVAPDAGIEFLAAVRDQGRHSATLPFRDAIGSPREVEVIGATHADTRNIVLNCRDITDRRRLEAQLAQANRLSSLGRLAATVSHEFNNVLMGVQPFVDVIRRKTTEPGVHNAATQIAGTVSRGKRITEEILRFTRPVEPILKAVPVRSWLQSMEMELRALAGPNMRVAIVAPEGLTVSADVSQFSQVLINLAINARDAGATVLRMEAGTVSGDGRFSFGIVSHPDQFAHFRFVDDGSGIPPAVLPHIFEPLFTTKTTRGTGLGLAVAQQVISRHGGELFVESKVGRGTTFHIFLPIAVSESGVLLIGDETLAAKPPSCRVLLVEDDSTVAEGIATLLEDDGFTVRLAITGGDALNAIPRFSPDLVVLDVGLPDIDGIEVYRRMTESWPSIPVIFSTGHADTASLPSTLPHAQFLLKPYTADELTAAIASALQPEKIVA